ncbi:MAG: STT3 domain-containing protein [Desulfurococcaceae archaeon]
MTTIKQVFRLIDDKIWRLVNYLNKKPTLSRTITATLIGLAVLLSILIRTATYNLNKIEFFEFDSYIEYWQANYVYEKGPFSWYSLTRSNPDTHIFWYPWGRDFIYTSYPFLPIWIGSTYHIVKYFGIDLFTWAAIQPIMFASIATIIAYFTAKEFFETRIAGLIASFLFAALPAAIERSVLGYVEKEGIAAVFVFLFLYLYAKAIKTISLNKTKNYIYFILAALSLSLVGWLWGGYVFILGTVVLFSLLSPIVLGKNLSKKLIYGNLLLVTLSMITVIPSPINSRTLGVYPISFKGIGWVFLLATLAPLMYYYLSVEYRRLGLRRHVLTPARYFLILIAIIVLGVSLSTMGYLPISGRWAWALGLRIEAVDPLVESIAEHQSPLATLDTSLRMLRSWGVFFEPLVIASPLAMSIAGIIYLLYTGHPAKIYLSLAFMAAFYSYLNAVYMIGVASYFGITVSSIMVSLMIKYAFAITARQIDKRKTRTTSRYSPGIKTRVVALLFFIAILANTSYTLAREYEIMSNMLYTFKAGLSDLHLFSNSWYKAVEVIREMPKDAVVIAWWDYGYGISVAGGRASIADGSTINITQIGLIGLTLLSNTPEQAAGVSKFFNVNPNKTYLMIIEGLFISEYNNTLYIIPPLVRGGMPGLVDWPKSIWMMRIGNYVAESLQKVGYDVNKSDTSVYIHVYRIGNQFLLSPRLDKIDELPLLYKLVIDASIYWAESNGKQGAFLWLVGNEQLLDYRTAQSIREMIKIDVKYSVVVNEPYPYTLTTTRPLFNNTILRPYAVIIEPFIDPRTGEPFKYNYFGYEGGLYSLILFYEFTSMLEE